MFIGYIYRQTSTNQQAGWNYRYLYEILRFVVLPWQLEIDFYWRLHVANKWAENEVFTQKYENNSKLMFLLCLWKTSLDVVNVQKNSIAFMPSVWGFQVFWFRNSVGVVTWNFLSEKMWLVGVLTTKNNNEFTSLFKNKCNRTLRKSWKYPFKCSFKLYVIRELDNTNTLI